MSNMNQKYYNPYPFPVRVIDDLGNVYVLEPQDYCKMLNGRYEQSVLKLPPIGGEREFKGGIEINLQSLKKTPELIPLAWAVGLDNVDQSKTKAEIIEMIEEKIGEEEEKEEEE